MTTNQDEVREEFEIWKRNHARRENREVREDEIVDYFISKFDTLLAKKREDDCETSHNTV